MNATNRIVNRTLLLVAGMLLAAVGLALILAATRPPWAAGVLDRAAQTVWNAVSGVAAWRIDVPGGGDIPGAVSFAIIAGLLLLVLLVVFLASRGGGSTSTVLRIADEHGATAVDRTVADAMLAGRMRERRDVLSAHTHAYRVRRAAAIKLTVTPRQGAQLPRLLGAVDGAVAEWDALTSAEIPIILHLQGRGWQDRWRSATRVR